MATEKAPSLPMTVRLGERAAPCQVCDEDRKFLLRTDRPDYEALEPTLRVVDLFAGCGGLSLGIAEGARRLGFGTTIRLAIEVDHQAAAVYRANFPGAKVWRRRVETCFDGRLGAEPTAVEARLARTVGSVDVLIGGPPCQGNSDLNNHTRRDDPRNALYARMARAAEILLPTMVLIENVPTVKHDVKNVVEVTIQTLREAGYAASEAILNLVELGAPQNRKRHIILALRDVDLDPSDVLQHLGPRCSAHETRSVGWAIEDLLDVARERMYDIPSTPIATNLERINWLFDNDKYDLPNDRRPKCHHSNDHSYVSMYGRLWWDKPAQTVTTGFGSMGQGRYVHPRQRRTITPHEAARLQMLPDFIDFGSAKTRGALAEMIGNAVPPVLAIAIAEATLEAVVAHDELPRFLSRRMTPV